MSGGPTGNLSLPPMPVEKSAAEVYQATSRGEHAEVAADLDRCCGSERGAAPALKNPMHRTMRVIHSRRKVANKAVFV